MYNTQEGDAGRAVDLRGARRPEVEGPALPADVVVHLQPVDARHDDQAVRRARTEEIVGAGWPTSRCSSTATPRSWKPSPPASATSGSPTTTTWRASWPRTPRSRWRRSGPNQATTGTHVNVSGAGVTAHAKNRANAIKFIEFLSEPGGAADVRRPLVRVPGQPAGRRQPDRRPWGKFKQDDINIAAAGEFQAAAVKLADRAGYK